MPKRILVVCHGSINRSPACGAILSAAGFDVRVRGFVNPGKRAAKKTREFMFANGYSLEAHRSELITQADVDWAELVVYMDNRNREHLLKFNRTGKKFRCLGNLLDQTKISDPGFMAKDSEKFKDTMTQVITASRRLAKELK